MSVPELEGAEAGLDRPGADPAMRIGILSVGIFRAVLLDHASTPNR
jgi:hypothetical protein